MKKGWIFRKMENGKMENCKSSENVKSENYLVIRFL